MANDKLSEMSIYILIRIHCNKNYKTVTLTDLSANNDTHFTLQQCTLLYVFLNAYKILAMWTCYSSSHADHLFRWAILTWNMTYLQSTIEEFQRVKMMNLKMVSQLSHVYTHQFPLTIFFMYMYVWWHRREQTDRYRKGEKKFTGGKVL